MHPRCMKKFLLKSSCFVFFEGQTKIAGNLGIFEGCVDFGLVCLGGLGVVLSPRVPLNVGEFPCCLSCGGKFIKNAKTCNAVFVLAVGKWSAKNEREMPLLLILLRFVGVGLMCS